LKTVDIESFRDQSLGADWKSIPSLQPMFTGWTKNMAVLKAESSRIW
jgi:hypothetical protein